MIEYMQKYYHLLKNRSIRKTIQKSKSREILEPNKIKF